MNDDELIDWIRKAGWVHTKEIAKAAGLPEDQPASLAACLSRLLGTGRLRIPSTMKGSLQVWWRTVDPMFTGKVGDARNKSREVFPEMWPKTARQRKSAEDRVAREQAKIRDLDELYELIERNSPPGLSLDSLAESFGVGRDLMRRRITDLDISAGLYQVPARDGSRGRPKMLWSTVQTPDTPKEKPAESVKTKAREDDDVSAIVEGEVKGDASWMD